MRTVLCAFCAKAIFFLKIWHQSAFDICAPRGFNEQIPCGDVRLEAQRRGRTRTPGLICSVPLPPLFTLSHSSHSWLHIHLILSHPAKHPVETDICGGGAPQQPCYWCFLFFAFSKIFKVLIRAFNLKTLHSKTNAVEISETALNQIYLSFIHK